MLKNLIEENFIKKVFFHIKFFLRIYAPKNDKKKGSKLKAS